MLFIFMLVISTMAIAGSAAFFSVYGLAQVFSGAFLSVIVMGASLEAGKLVAASFLYRCWDKTSLFLRTYLMVAILVLMGITSMGISGYLTSAYQIDTISLRDMDEKLTAYKEEREQLQNRKREMDEQIRTNTEANYVSAAQRLMESFKPEYQKIDAKLATLQTDIASLQTEKITTESKVGPIIFISRVLKAETDDAIFWLVILLVTVFDPLAVALTIATNIAIRARIEERKLASPMGQPQAASQPEFFDATVDSIEVSAPTETNEMEVTVDAIEEAEPVDDNDLEAAIRDLEDKMEKSLRNRTPTADDLKQREALERALRRKRLFQNLRRTAGQP